MDTIYNYEYSKENLIKGISKVASVIRPTYGPYGSNVILQDHLYPFHRITNDGKLIADSIILSHPIENIGAQVLKEAADKAQRESGDGRKTTMLLAESIITQGFKENSITPLQLKKQLDDCLPLILDSIKSQTTQITDCTAVATLASESETIGKEIGTIYQTIGKDGIIEVEPSGLRETTHTLTDGVRLRGAGYFGEYACTEPGKAVRKNPYIFVTKDRITSINQLENVLKPLAQKKINEVVIYCEDMDLSVASILARSHVEGAFKTLIIKSPKLFREWLYDDLAAITGAVPVDSSEGRTFKNFKPEQLGTCESLITTKDETRIIGIKDITAHIKSIEERKDEQYQVRLSWLQTKVATLKVGAGSESELSYYMKKANDGCSAAYWALQEGVVNGGGASLVAAIEKLPATNGGAILAHALRVPFDILDSQRITVKGIHDAAVVVRNAIKNAISIAGIVLTCSGAIPFPKVDSNGN